MGIYLDLSSTSPIADKPLAVGLDRSSNSQMLANAAISDPSLRTAYAAIDELAPIPEQTDAGSSDTYTLTLTPHGRLSGEDAVTTASIAFDATASTIESAIDTAMASFPSWSNADISVAEENSAGLDDGFITLTFDGTSVDETAWIVTLVATGFTETTPIVRTTPGQGDRKATQALFELNIVAGSLHDIPDTPTWTKPDSLGRRPRTHLIGDLAKQATAEDGNDEAYDAVKVLYPEI